MEHWKEPDVLASAQRTGYGSPAIMGMGQETNAMQVPVNIPAAGPTPPSPETMKRRGRRGGGMRMHPGMGKKKWVPVLVIGALGFFAGMAYARR